MSFASHQFIFLFLPITFTVFWSVQRKSVGAALWALSIASGWFYAAWDPKDILVAGSSIAFNYLSAHQILTHKARARSWLTFAIVVDIGVLLYFKYLNFIASGLEYATGSAAFHLRTIVLPLGVSFFTFTQIAYLVDCAAGKVRPEQHNARDYILFVAFFPHLIAGPILHHANIIPQFHREFRLDWSRKVSAGVMMFVIGLGKKVVLADNLAKLATPSFDHASKGFALTVQDAWLGIISYTLQLYFDFSGYSDMAVGAALMVGIMIPFNFNSPYRALSIIDFWRRWHMSLSTFLRDYLYIPLGGSRGTPGRRYFNIFTTMLLGGIWHGAGINFVIWGFIHGALIVMNHLWRDFAAPLFGRLRDRFAFKVLAYLLTMLGVMLGWVFFRASDFSSAVRILHAAVGHTGADLLRRETGVLPAWLLIGISATIAAWPVNSLRIHDDVMSSTATIKWPAIMLRSGLLFALCIAFISADSPFLYFQF